MEQRIRMFIFAYNRSQRKEYMIYNEDCHIKKDATFVTPETERMKCFTVML